MPIGIADYVSALPGWNDPLNPFPACSRLLLSAADVSLGAGVVHAYDLQVGSLQPYARNGYGMWAYECVDQIGGSSPVMSYGNAVDGQMKVASTVGSLYIIPTPVTRRDIPAGFIQGNAAWNGVEGDDVTTLSIIADINYITPYEHRRRWCLNG